MVWGKVESGAGAAQSPLPFLVTLTELQVTVTADTGMVGQPVKLSEDAWTVAFQGSLWFPL